MKSSDFQPAFATAAETAHAVRDKRISATELLNLDFQRIDRYNPKLNAIVWQDREQALARAKQARCRPGRGQIPKRTSWRADYHQGIVRLSRVAQHLGFATAKERNQSSDRGCRGAPGICRCDCRGQDQCVYHAGRLAKLKPGLRSFEQSVGPCPDPGWIDGWGRGCAGCGAGVSHHRQRSHGLGPDPGALLRRLCA
jgi:hypothetical protein